MSELPQRVSAAIDGVGEHEEYDLEKYARETRDDIRTIKVGVLVIAWIVGIAAAISLILGLILGVQIYKFVNAVNQQTGVSSASSCYSEGGNDLSC
jgi:uncharacterized membrane protein